MGLYLLFRLHPTNIIPTAHLLLVFVEREVRNYLYKSSNAVSLSGDYKEQRGRPREQSGAVMESTKNKKPVT